MARRQNRFTGSERALASLDRATGHSMYAAYTRRKTDTRLEDWPTYAAVFLSPFLNVGLSLVNFTVSDGFFCLAFGVMLLRGRLPREPLYILNWTWFLAYFLVVSGLYVSSLAAGDPIRGLILALQYSFCFLVLPFILVKSDILKCYKLLKVFIAGVFFLDAHGMVTFYTIGYVPGVETVTGNMRLGTLYGNPNGAACLNAMTIVLVFWLLSVRQLSRTIGLSLLGILTWALILTSSNTGLISLLIGTTIYAALTFRPYHLLYIFLFASVLTLFFLYFGVEYLPSTFQERVLPSFVEGDLSEAGTFLHRADLMREAIELIERQKIFLWGIGADQFRVISVQEAPVHNVFLLLWVEGGFVSLLGWLVLLSSGILLWCRAWVAQIMTQGRAAVLSCFIMFVIVSSANAHLYARPWYTVLLLILAPTIVALRQSDGQRYSLGSKPVQEVKMG